MKRKSVQFVLIPVILVSLIISGVHRKPGNDVPLPEKKGTAVIITGAAARIPQEAALLEELYNRGLLKDVVFISGVSSGAINAVLLNGILSDRFTWQEYRDFLFNLKNSDVFIQEGDRRLPVNTSPEKALFEKVVEERLGFHSIGDLPVTTEISVTESKALGLKHETYRMASRKINAETDTTLSIVEILMASTAFPLAFPPVKINNTTTIPVGEYIDGGVGDDHVPFHGLLDFQKKFGFEVEKVYIISRKNDSIPEVSEELKALGIDDKGRFDKMGISIDNIFMKGIIKRLEAFAEEVPELESRTYVYVPGFREHFLFFNFDNLKEQYLQTAKWAKQNDPVLLRDFLEKERGK